VGKNTQESYSTTLSKFRDHHGNDRQLDGISSEEILSFLNKITEGGKQQTKHGRYSQLKAFFNFIRTNFDPALQNPCDAPMLRKLYRPGKLNHWNIFEKETVDEIIFRTIKVRNRLILELMARGGMRVGEVLKLTTRHVNDQKLILQAPKSGNDEEVVFIPRRVADRLNGYIREKSVESGQRIFPITYAGARLVVKKAGKLVGIELRPHDLRRHAATYASRSGVPIEIVSKVILRHANLSTTQRYLGKISDTEATRWIENLYG
jgi:integrase/recombinase XerD